MGSVLIESKISILNGSPKASMRARASSLASQIRTNTKRHVQHVSMTFGVVGPGSEYARARRGIYSTANTVSAQLLRKQQSSRMHGSLLAKVQTRSTSQKPGRHTTFYSRSTTASKRASKRASLWCFTTDVRYGILSCPRSALGA